ncbi:MAG: hypothetical protein R6U84_04995 [Candidatus Cloacimonadales bacterium]
MKRNSLRFFQILFFLLLSLQGLSAQDFFVQYRLGSAALRGTKIDIYNYQSGYSLAEKANYAFRQVEHPTEFEIDYDNNLIVLTAKFSSSSDIQLFPQIYLSLDQYYARSFRSQFRQILLQEVRESFADEERSEGQGLIPEIVIELPKIAQTRTVRRLLGENAGRLSLNGSQKVTLEGGYNYNSNRDSENDNARDFNMAVRQDLNLQLRGTVGEKIHVNVSHRSSEDDILSEPSEVNVRYEGTEDEIVKTIDGGNISLALSGSKYISYNAASEGLFGIKSTMKVGNLDITTIVGQDQAKKDNKSYSNSAEADSAAVYSKNYVNRTHYFISEPQELYQIHQAGDQINVGGNLVDIPPGWVDNAIRTSPDGRWLLSPQSDYFLPDKNAEFTLYLDDHSASNNETTIPGVEWDDPDYDWDDDNEEDYNFEIMIEGKDYIVDYDTGIIKINKSISRIYTIGITYTSQSGRTVGNASANPVQVKLLRKRNQDIIDDPHYWKMQVRNIYSMGLEGGIKAEGFELDVYNENEADGVFNFTTPDTISFAPGIGERYNDYLRLDSNNSGKVDADDVTVNLDTGMIIFPFLEPFRPLGELEIYTSEGDNVLNSEVKMMMQVKGKIGRSSINLGLNIMPNSVVVKLGPNKEKLVEGVDYIVDYDFGDVTMLSEKAKDTSQEIFIDYQFKPLFAIDSKTIMGFRADLDITDNFRLGSTFIYQSEKVKEDRPKIGNENRTVILADIDGEISFDMPLITRAVDFLPLIKTDEKSSITLGAEAAVSLTKIFGSDKQSDKKEAYVEDMESILDPYPLGITRESWVAASRPYHLQNYGKAKANWFNPDDVRAQDVYIPESLADDERNDIVPILGLRMQPNQLQNPGMQNFYWSGLMKYVGNEVDFSKKKYIEFLVKVNDDPQTLSKPRIKMHINLGDISEDFYTEQGGLGVLNREERTDTGLFNEDQDIGLDGIPDGLPGDDPNDDYSTEIEMVYGEQEFPQINGTEGNSRLDTEDLNDNSVLDLAEIFYEYSIDLNQDVYLQSEYNGWRLYRVPLNDANGFQKISNNANKEADLSKISFARIWFEIEQECKIKLVNLDIVGNKWIEDPIKDQYNQPLSETALNNNNQRLSVGIVDNQKNPHYTPAPGTVIEKIGESSLEQSLIVNYQNFQSGHNGLAVQEFTDKLNFLGYERIRFWVYGEKPQDHLSDYQPQNLIIRIGANETNYYEIRKPLVIRDYAADLDNDQNPIMKASYWNDEDNPQIDIPFSDLTFLKNETDPAIIDMGDYLYYEKDGYQYRRVGDPTLSNIKELSLGLEATETFSGNIYFDDIRVANPFEEPGYAGFVNFSTKFADFANFSADMEVKSQNFNTSTARTQNYSYDAETSFNLSSNVALQKFFPATWGLRIPLTFNRSQSLRQSRFKANSDILRENLSAEDKEREQTKSLVYRSSLNLSQDQTPKYKIVEYLMKNSRWEANIQKKHNSTPTSADSTLSYSAKHVYNLTYSQEDVEIKPWNSLWQKIINVDHKLYFFPTSLSNSINYDVQLPEKWTWRTQADSLPYWEWSTSNDTTKTVSTNSTIAYRFTSDLKFDYNLRTTRDMLMQQYQNDFNIGTEKTRNQKLSFTYNPELLKTLIATNYSGSADYNERRIDSYSQTDSLDVFHFNGGVTRKFNADITLKNRDLLSALGSWLGSKMTPAKADAKSEPPKSAEQLEAPDKPQTDEKPAEIDKPKSAEKPDPDFADPARSDFGLTPDPNRDPAKPQLPQTPAGKEGQADKDSDKNDPKQTLPPNDRDQTKDGEGQTAERNVPLLVQAVNYLSRLENINLRYDNSYNTNYDEVQDKPEFLYQLGMPDILRSKPDTLFAEDGTILEILPEQITVHRESHKIITSSSFQILRNLSTNLSYTWETTKSFKSNNETNRIVFPNLSLTLTEFEKLIRLENILTSSRLSSSFSRSVEEGGDLNFSRPNRETENLAFSPLISWNGNFGDDISSSISYNNSFGEEINHFYTQGSEVRQLNALSSINGNVSYSFKAPRGLRIPFIGDRIRFQNELTASLALSYEQRENKTKRNEEPAIKNVDRTAITVTPSASYKFSRNINAGLSYQYDKSLEKTTDLTLITNRLSLWIEITF